ncbi:MAG: hypothetical protein RXR20_17365 [Paraburkholderia sp.]|jgi:hypothetical protein|uniref:hypothetical protein n=1 Tax=Burkholderiaceae TaxID=119060 RepID=UPI0010F64B93|nr:hypothetical protein [Burkholderia sp. 4M9327F10]
MSWYQASRSIAAAALVAATALLSACGGGGSGSGSAASSAASNQLKLSTAVQSEPVARYAAAFGILSGPGVAAIYTSVVQSLVSSVSASTATATTVCPASGSIVVATQNAGTSGLQGGETATVNFNQCVGQVSAPGVSSSATVSGSVTVQVQSAQGVVGDDTANWSYTAVESANNLTLVSSNGTTVLNGTATFTMSYDAATGVTTTTASSPSVTLNITHAATSGNVSGTISITSLSYSRVHDSDPSGDTVSTSGGISVQASDAVIAFNVTTPTPVTISNGVVQGGVIQLSGDNAVESITPGGNSTVNISVTANGQTGTYSETLDSLRQLTGS